MMEAIEYILNNNQYNITMIEYNIHFITDNTTEAHYVHQFLKQHFHISRLKKGSLLLKQYPNTIYGSYPRQTNGRATRIYPNRTNELDIKLEYILKSN